MIARQRSLASLADLTLAPRDGRTRLIRSVTRPPFVVQRALYVDDAAPDLALVILANPTAGLFAGDLVEISIDLEPGARAQVTTPSATKVHAMPDGSARQITHLSIGATSYLEYLPEPVIPQQASRFKQHTSIQVAPGGRLVYSDILAGGRLAMGESLAYTEVENRLTVSTSDNRILYHEAFTLTPTSRSPRGLGIFGRGGEVAMGTMLIVSFEVDSNVLARDVSEAVAAIPDARVGVAILPGGGGVAVKALSRETDPLRAVERVAWAVARQQLLGVGLPSQRKY